jgi:Leucine-rich repeat (LRR) protein
MLVSPSLKWLDLSNCKIQKVVGDEVIEGLKQLEYLHLDGNPLRTIPDMSSSSLKHLHLSGCKLTNLQPTALSKLTALTYINLARNTQLSFSTKPKEYLRSESLKRIDLSYCNLDTIPLSGFPNLVMAILKGNMLKLVTADSFYDNPALEIVDLSSNSITYISGQSFRQLPALKQLDLSYNMIQKIEKDTFVENVHLTDINLSKTYLSKFGRLEADSLAHLNMSYCEIMEIEPDAMTGLPSLKMLDLSKNIISEIPPNFTSASLQILDLSYCRLSIVRNYTFASLPELIKLDLSGNRFTSPFKVNYFHGNRFLKEISLGDNPWRCECERKEFQNFFEFLTDPPGKVSQWCH